MIRTASLALFFGVVILHHLPQLPPEHLLFIAPVTLALLFKVKTAPIRIVLFVMLGFSWAHLQAHHLLSRQLPESHIGKDIRIEGFITSLPLQTERMTRFEFKVTSVLLPADITIPDKLMLSAYHQAEQAYRPGDKWRFTVRLKPPHDLLNPGGFSYRKWLLQQGILATGYVRNPSQAQRLEAEALSYPWQRLRFTLKHRLQQLSIDRQTLPFVLALLIGDRSMLGNDDWAVLQNTGTIHLMAISGLHVGLIAAVVFFLVRLIWSLIPKVTNYIPAPRIAAVMAWLAAFFYSALAGFSLPTQRALIMLSVVLLAVVMQKRLRPSIVLCVSLLAIVIFDSFAVLSISFWLSFSAVAVIYYFIYISSRVQYSQYASRFKLWLYLQTVISLGLLPLTILFFQQAPILSPIANMIAVPVVGFIIVPLCFLALFALLIHPFVAQTIFDIVNLVFVNLWRFLHWFADLSFSHYSFSASSLLTVLLAITGLIIFCLPGVFRLRLVGLVLCLPVMFPIYIRSAEQEFSLTALDVGQGLAVVVRTKNHTLVYDTGPRYSESYDTGRVVVIPYLQQVGINHIDRLIITHGDNDHIGGTRSVLAGMSVADISSSVPEKIRSYKNTRAYRCYQGQSWQWDGVYFSILHPNESDYSQSLSENDLSCVLLIDNGKRRVLLTGDIERTAEALILQRFENLRDIDLLVVPHHGSKTSSSVEFVEQLLPTIAIVPVGWRNRFRLPDSEVIKRYRTNNVQVYQTGDSGAVSYQSDTGKIDLFRDRIRYYWAN